MAQSTTGHWTFTREIYKPADNIEIKKKKAAKSGSRRLKPMIIKWVNWYINLFMPRSHNPELREIETLLPVMASGFKSFAGFTSWVELPAAATSNKVYQELINR